MESTAQDEAPFDWSAWQARKQAAWEADEHALAVGETTREQLGRENGAVPEHIAKAPLSWEELPLVAASRLSEILERLEPVAQDLVLVGGQAVHFWASRYKERVPELQREWPYTTKDLDFCGTAAQARECARVLGGRCMRELLLDTLDQSVSNARAVRSALQMSERIFRLAESDAGLRAKMEHGIVLDAIVLDPRTRSASAGTFRQRR